MWILYNCVYLKPVFVGTPPPGGSFSAPPALVKPTRTFSQNKLYIAMEECYDQYRSLEKERKKVRAYSLQQTISIVGSEIELFRNLGSYFVWVLVLRSWSKFKCCIFETGISWSCHSWIFLFSCWSKSSCFGCNLSMAYMPLSRLYIYVSKTEAIHFI